MLGQQKIDVQIEIGDKVLDPNTLEKCIVNGNFAVKFRRHVIVKIF